MPVSVQSKAGRPSLQKGKWSLRARSGNHRCSGPQVLAATTCSPGAAEEVAARRAARFDGPLAIRPMKSGTFRLAGVQGNGGVPRVAGYRRPIHPDFERVRQSRIEDNEASVREIIQDRKVFEKVIAEWKPGYVYAV